MTTGLQVQAKIRRGRRTAKYIPLKPPHQSLQVTTLRVKPEVGWPLRTSGSLKRNDVIENVSNGSIIQYRKIVNTEIANIKGNKEGS